MWCLCSVLDFCDFDMESKSKSFFLRTMMSLQVLNEPTNKSSHMITSNKRQISKNTEKQCVQMRPI